MLGGLYAKKPDVSNLLAQEIGQLLTKFLSKWYYFYRAHLLWNSSPLNLFHLPITLIKSYSKWYYFRFSRPGSPRPLRGLVMTNLEKASKFQDASIFIQTGIIFRDLHRIESFELKVMLFNECVELCFRNNDGMFS